MKAAKKFLALPGCRQWLLLRSAVILATVRVGLAIFPFPVLLGLHARLTSRRSLLSRHLILSPDHITWAVSVAGRRVPGAQNCLVQALAGAILLLRAGHPSLLCIGVNRSSGNPLDAHAWVELDGRPVIGAVREHRYTCLFSWDGGWA